MKQVPEKIKEQFKKLTDNPIYLAAAALVLVLLIGGLAVLAFTGGDGEDDGGGTTSDEQKEKDEKAREEAKKRKVKPAPVVTGTGTLDTARSVGRLAVAQARGRVKKPVGIRVRVSAAPKQTVTVDWQLSCYAATGKTSRTKVAKGRYRARTPETRSLSLPMSGADECTTTVGAQLTRNESSGRVKVTVIAG